MSVPRGLAKRIDFIEKAIRQRLPEKHTAEEVRHEIQAQLAEEKFYEIFRVWESEFETILNGADERAITEAAEELKLRIEREPIMQTLAWGPRIQEMNTDETQSEVTTLADIFCIIVENLRDRELLKIRMESRDSEGWQPTRV